ncbi:MAG: hypothetical protein MZV65_18625 [Chromatiales bacterium]|nr:hypothetical protein [Chromatiales bacterium]
MPTRDRRTALPHAPPRARMPWPTSPHERLAGAAGGPARGAPRLGPRRGLRALDGPVEPQGRLRVPALARRACRLQPGRRSDAERARSPRASCAGAAPRAVIAIDRSEAYVAEARARIRDPRAQLEVGDGADTGTARRHVRRDATPGPGAGSPPGRRGCVASRR